MMIEFRENKMIQLRKAIHEDWAPSNTSDPIYCLPRPERLRLKKELTCLIFWFVSYWFASSRPSRKKMKTFFWGEIRYIEKKDKNGTENESISFHDEMSKQVESIVFLFSFYHNNNNVKDSFSFLLKIKGQNDSSCLRHLFRPLALPRFCVPVLSRWLSSSASTSFQPPRPPYLTLDSQLGRVPPLSKIYIKTFLTRLTPETPNCLAKIKKIAVCATKIKWAKNVHFSLECYMAQKLHSHSHYLK